MEILSLNKAEPLDQWYKVSWILEMRLCDSLALSFKIFRFLPFQDTHMMDLDSLLWIHPTFRDLSLFVDYGMENSAYPDLMIAIYDVN